MAPEIIKGDDRITRAADYYSLGISLYKLLAGETPFGGAVNEVFAGHLREEVRFEEEKTVYAELYPHVLGLVGKEINPRLEAFGAFRTAVTGRMGGGVEELERAYGQSVILSIGSIGKEEIWRELMEWLHRVTSYSKYDKRDTTVDRGFSRNNYPRILSITGPEESGKSYLAESLAREAMIRKCRVVGLGQNDYLNPLFSDNTEFDSQNFSNTASRFIEGWKNLAEDSLFRSSLLIVEDYDSLSAEEQDFLRYLKGRIEISTGNNINVPVSIVITGRIVDISAIRSKFLPQTDRLIELSLSSIDYSELERLAGLFSGEISRSTHSERFIDYLSSFSYSAGSVFNGLNHSFLKNRLTYRSGVWNLLDFSTGDTAPADYQTAYYRTALNLLSDNDIGVLTWLSCHSGPVPVDVVSNLSEYSTNAIFQSVDTINTYLTINRITTDYDDLIDIPNRHVKTIILERASISFRNSIHEKYVDFYESAIKSSAKLDRASLIKHRRQLSYQYHATSQTANWLTNQLRLFKELSLGANTHVLKKEYVNSIRLLNNLNNVKSGYDPRLIIRYFVKRLIKLEWNESNYLSIIDLVRYHFIDDGRRIPPYILFYYGLSLDLSDMPNMIRPAIQRVREGRPSRRSEVFLVSELLETHLYIRNGNFRSAQKTLSHIEQFKDVLSPFFRSRYLICLSMFLEQSGDLVNYVKTIDLLVDLSKKHEFTNELLIAYTAKLSFYFEQSRFDEARKLVNTGLKISASNNLIHRKCTWYYRASGIYYEEGNYKRAISYASKALKTAESLGMKQLVCELLTRHAMIYQNMGMYGNAAKYLEQVRTVGRDDLSASNSILVDLFSFDLQLTMKNPSLSEYRLKLDKLMKKSEQKWRRGYYEFLMGQYHESTGNYLRAVDSYKHARRLYRKLEVFDDEMRASLKEAKSNIALKRFDAARVLLNNVKATLDRIPSKTIIADYWCTNLLYHYMKRTGKNLLSRKLQDAEKHASAAYEVPALLEMEKLLFRVNARLGNIEEAKAHFARHLKLTKKVISNISDYTSPESFITHEDDTLFRAEFQIIHNRSRKPNQKRRDR
jgi:tetratricopeptide (TPR) repeat protein